VTAPPDSIRLAAAVVERYLQEQAGAKLSADEIARLTPAEKLDYARRFKQDQMPAWDPNRIGAK
jgi:hypothetical protein